jgi:KDO2-lipid IV(A) lauroyltransferase
MAKQRGRLQTDLEYAAVRLLLGGLGLLPRRASVAMGRALGHAAYALAGGLRRTGRRNLELAFPEMGAEQRQRILRGTFQSLGRLLGEFAQLPRATAESMRAYVEYSPDSVRLYHEALARGKGVIFLTSHLGAWEVLSFAQSVFDVPLSFLVRPIDNPRVEELVERFRTRLGNRPIDKKAAARTALRVLRDGGTLGILADLNTQAHEGVFVPFFGRLACTTTSVAVLALRTDAVVMPSHATWDRARGRYVLHCDPPLELIRTGDLERDVSENTGLFASVIERQIREHPDQWLWIHKRWKTRPAGEPDLYGKDGVKELTESKAPPSQEPALSTKPQKF